MKFSVATIAFLASSVAAVQLSFDNHYDDAGASLTTVACSDGPNGLMPRFSTFGSLPGFPHIGAVDAITGWNSPKCGSCWQITYPQTGNTVNVIGVDRAGNGFNVAQQVMDELTNGQAVALGTIQVDAQEVSASDCGL